MFEKKVIEKVIDSISNEYTSNVDYIRYNTKKEKVAFSFKLFLKKKLLQKRFLIKLETILCLNKTMDFLSLYGTSLSNLYKNLENNESKNILIEIIAFRILGNRKVKLSTNTREYHKKISESYLYANSNDFIDIKFGNYRLLKTDFSAYNQPLIFYTMPTSMVVYEFLGQYNYKNPFIGVAENDVVLDCGGCFGDTALLFACKAGIKGKIYSFEFIPSNLSIFKKNLSENPNIQNIEIIENPLWTESNTPIWYKDNGPGSKICMEDFIDSEGVVKTISIDDFIQTNKIEKVDFIKMDIEGAELPVLKGAIETIKTYKPKLAISLYHSMNDFTQIPEFLINLQLGYKFYLGHYTIHSEETVLYAII